MILEAIFKEANHEINSKMGDVYVVADYGKDYADGYDKGHDAGYINGYEEGEGSGYISGYKQGYDVGFEEGQAQGGGGGDYNIGWDDGYTQGYTEGELNGWDSGYSSGWDEGNEEGKQAQEDAFWDAYQQNGTRTDYACAFGGNGWMNDTFKPKYDMKPTNAMYMFRASKISGDLVALLDRYNVTLDFSECTSGVEIFSNASNITRVGVIDVSKMGNNIANMFSYCGVKTIDKVIVAETQQMLYFPGAMYSLENISFEGTIGQSGMNLRYSTKLSKASIISVIDALSTTTSGLSITLSKTAVDNAFYDEDGEGVIGSTSSAWAWLLDTKPNWTINLV